MQRVRIKDVMTRRPTHCSPDTKLDVIASLMLAHNCGEIPVCEGTKLVGVVTDRDIAIRGFTRGSNPLDITARDVMTDRLYTVAEDADAETAAALMKTQRVRRLPVVRNGDLVGIVSQGDLIGALSPPRVVDFVKAISRRPV